MASPGGKVKGKREKGGIFLFPFALCPLPFAPCPIPHAPPLLKFGVPNLLLDPEATKVLLGAELNGMGK
ncbi:hypothetical protein NIES25_41760 [Nostoc linckia NIES-25]|nr:hypothetical protein NIES25_41760 [Nostoc linckia NIES-25]